MAGEDTPARLQSRPTRQCQTQEFWKILGGLISQVSPFKMTIVGLLPWGSSGHDKSKDPVNNHKKDGD